MTGRGARPWTIGRFGRDFQRSIFTKIIAELADGRLRAALGRDRKGKLSPFLDLAGSAFFAPGVADAVYAAVALLWLVPDRRLEKALATGAEP